MRKALQLAERGRGLTSPNPMVGAVVVDRDGVLIGRGSHEVAGGPHAEVYALNAAGPGARGATLYCTLEPCSHTGRTGPCAPLVADAGIARVVVATEDPNPLVAGRGLQLLRERGLVVVTGVLARDAERLNGPFFTFMRARRPFVTMKVAVSADGKIAAGPGERTLLTSEAANRQVHRDRAETDAIAVGSGTMLVDDPTLTARRSFRPRPLTRVIFDGRLRTPPSARIFTTLDAGPVIIVGYPRAAASRGAAAELRDAGAILEFPADGRIGTALEALAAKGITSLIVDGGAALHRAFWHAGVVDRVQVYVTTRVLGERGVSWLPFDVMASPHITERSSRALGDDVLLEAYVHRTY
ncbi:MAG: bifunctional diaminohydroxyphosphoribosylaminopyrimidine deaminase/5-amino-6-(5-phosphoribosylamino)uracil reductase RibD [Acidobacteria bacterium]|nr:bifunctional diaminohydroxyphosphoribosylaminopyrimidine deaminase/5-amino-6-(5-phosphoribosylamino)uracil reductase RibD [Acidobacteriota bacterium]